MVGLEAADPRSGRPGEPLPREEDEGAEGGLAIDAGKGKYRPISLSATEAAAAASISR
jgi:hypothetical protein